MLTVWGRTTSSNVMKVLWLLHELGVVHDRIDAGGAFGRTDTPEYRAMSPLGLVPVLQDGAFSLFESNAILRHLAATQPGGEAFWPLDPHSRAHVDAWMDFQQTALGPPAGELFMSAVRTPEPRRDPARIAASTQATGRIWSLLDGVLATRPFVAADRLSLADMALGPHVHRWFAMPIERPDLPHLRRWYDTLLARPAYARSCANPPE